MGALNLYGDRLIATSGSHGGDISGQRMDALDRASLQAVVEADGSPLTVLDIGCGSGTHGMRMAMAGARVQLFDKIDIQARVDQFADIFPWVSISFHRGDAADVLKSIHIPDGVDIAYTQRTIHYLDFDRAVGLLRSVRAQANTGIRVFLSASGLNSPLGAGYADREVPLNKRFAVLDAAIGAEHQILEPVCLYTIKDIGTLADAAKFSVSKIWSSDFGNIKAILEL